MVTCTSQTITGNSETGCAMKSRRYESKGRDREKESLRCKQALRVKDKPDLQRFSLEMRIEMLEGRVDYLVEELKRLGLLR